MKKSALIFALVALVLIIGVSLISPICTPCLAILLGGVAGYLAGVFDKPLEKSAAVKGGALAGLLAGIGAILGQIVGAIINSTTVGPEGAQQLMQQLGLSTGGDYATTYWIAMVASTVCFGLLNLAIMAGMGALGGMLWNSFNNKQVPTPPAPPVIINQ